MNKVASIGFRSYIGFITCMGLLACHQKVVPTVHPTPVNLDTVSARMVTYYDQYPATTESLKQVTIYPQIQGYITKIFVKDGSFVKKGQPLFEIDTRLYQAANDEALANLKVAQDNRVQMKQDADRYEYLNKYNAVAKQLYDHAVIALQVAESQVKAAEEAMKATKTNLSYSLITAPFDGTVGFSQVQMGNMVTVGQTVLNTISANAPMAVDFLLNEKQLPAFEKLKKGKASDYPDSLFTILLSNNTLYPYTGEIYVIDRAVDSQTGTIRIRLVFPNPENELKVGMSCVIRVHNQEATPQVLVPNKAITEQMGEYFVFLAKDTTIVDTSKQKGQPPVKSGPTLRAIQKKVQVGQTIGPNIIIVSGVKAGDRIVVDGIQNLHDGSIIQVHPNNQAQPNSQVQPSKQTQPNK